MPECRPVLNTSVDQTQATWWSTGSFDPFHLIRYLIHSLAPSRLQRYQNDKATTMCSTNIGKLTQLPAAAPMQTSQSEHWRVQIVCYPLWVALTGVIGHHGTLHSGTKTEDCLCQFSTDIQLPQPLKRVGLTYLG